MASIKIKDPKTGKTTEFSEKPSVWESVTEGVMLDPEVHKQVNLARMKLPKERSNR